MNTFLIKVPIFLFCFLTQTSPYTTALQLYNSGNYNKAIRFCTDELNKLKTSDSLYLNFTRLRADCYKEAKQYDKAINDCKTLIKIQPQATSNYGNIGYLYGVTGDFESAVKILKMGLNINPKDVFLLNNLAYYSSQLYNFSEAITYANTGLKLTTDKQWLGSLLNNRAYGYIGLKEYKLALSDINKSLIYTPDNSYAYCYRAIANIGLNNFKTVCDDLQKAKNLGGIQLTKDLIAKYCH